MVQRRLVYMYLLNVPSVSSRYVNKIKRNVSFREMTRLIARNSYPVVEIMSTFCADSAHWRFYNNKRLVKHALFIPRVNSNVLAKQISSLVNSHFER